MGSFGKYEADYLAGVTPARFNPEPLHRPELSFVVPAFNEADNIAETLARISEKASSLVKTCEIIVVDDGSHDLTIETARAVKVLVPVSILRLSRNFGKEQAIMAGLQRAKGQAVIILDADLQEPLHYVDLMLEKYRAGYEMVYAVRAHRDDESWAKRVFTKAFYKLLNHGSDADIPADARDFRLMDRKVVDALCALPERNRFMKGLYGWVGFKSVAVPVVVEERRNGASKFGVVGLFKLALTGLTAFTSWPLRIWTSVGMTLAVLSIFYGVWLAARTAIWGHALPGWSTLATAIFFLGGVQLISIGILGEYIARIFLEVKGRPGYLVAEEIHLDSAP
jgi:glycosyltransferase involved in cell wall biosynthesis